MSIRRIWCLWVGHDPVTFREWMNGLVRPHARDNTDVREIAVLLRQASGAVGLCRRCGLPMEEKP